MGEQSNGTAYFLVHDEKLSQANSGGDPFVEWLKSKGYKVHDLYHGCWAHVTALYINLNSKTYAFGMPGIRLFEPIGNHAITIEEFKSIYATYKKYEGKAPFVFS